METNFQEIKTAQKYYEQALEIFDEFNDPYQRALIYRELAVVTANINTIDKALGYWSQAQAIYDALGDQYARASLDYQIGEQCLKLNHTRLAEEHYNSAYQAFDRLAQDVESAECLIALYKLYAHLGEILLAERFFSLAGEAIQRVGTPEAAHILIVALHSAEPVFNVTIAQTEENLISTQASRTRELPNVELLSLLASSPEISRRVEAGSTLFACAWDNRENIETLAQIRSLILNLANDSAPIVRRSVLNSAIQNYYVWPVATADVIRRLVEDRDIGIRLDITNWLFASKDILTSELGHSLCGILARDLSPRVQDTIYDTVRELVVKVPPNQLPGINEFINSYTASHCIVEIIEPDAIFVDQECVRTLAIKNTGQLRLDKVDITLVATNDCQVEVEHSNDHVCQVKVDRAKIYIPCLESKSAVRITTVLHARRPNEVQIVPIVNGQAMPSMIVLAILSDPYQFGSPVDSQFGPFFGRKDMIEKLISGLTKPNKVDSLIIGERRSGKTSILIELAHRLPKPHLAVSINFAESDKSAKSCVDYIVRRIIATAVDSGMLAPTEQLSMISADNLTDAVKPVMRQINASSPKTIVVLLADESDDLLDIEARMQSLLRATLQSDIAASFRAVLAGTSRFLDGISTATSPLYNHFRVETLRPFAYDEARDLVVKPIQPLGRKFSDEALKLIISASGGHPYYCQRICYSVYERASYVDAMTIESELVRTTIKNIISDSNDAALLVFREDVWRRISVDERNKLVQLAYAKRLPVHPAPELRRLNTWHVIATVDGYLQFTADIFGDFVKSLGRLV